MYVRLMALMVTPAVDNFVDALDQLAAEDPMLLSQAAQLGNAEVLTTQQNRLAYVFSRLINAMWSSEATVDTFGLSVKGWLVQDQHLSPNDAASRVAVARELLVRDEVAGALQSG